MQDWIAAVGARTAHIKPGSKWEQGCCKRFNTKFRCEPLKGQVFYSPNDAQILVKQWSKNYSTMRPHLALQYHRPFLKTDVSPWTKGTSCTNNKIGSL